jgi:hypothetical protein
VYFRAIPGIGQHVAVDDVGRQGVRIRANEMPPRAFASAGTDAMLT